MLNFLSKHGDGFIALDSTDVTREAKQMVEDERIALHDEYETSGEYLSDDYLEQDRADFGARVLMELQGVSRWRY